MIYVSELVYYIINVDGDNSKKYRNIKTLQSRERKRRRGVTLAVNCQSALRVFRLGGRFFFEKILTYAALRLLKY
jgi:hypothetical protein